MILVDSHPICVLDDGLFTLIQWQYSPAKKITLYSGKFSLVQILNQKHHKINFKFCMLELPDHVHLAHLHVYVCNFVCCLPPVDLSRLSDH